MGRCWDRSHTQQPGAGLTGISGRVTNRSWDMGRGNPLMVRKALILSPSICEEDPPPPCPGPCPPAAPTPMPQRSPLPYISCLEGFNEGPSPSPVVDREPHLASYPAWASRVLRAFLS